MALKADEEGRIVGQFTVPPKVPTGAKLVRFIGDQGNYGEATYTARGVITTEERRKVTTITDVRRDETTVVLTRYDPLAQTFTLSESRHIGGIDLWFTVAGNHRIVVQIRDTLIGTPNQTVLAEQGVSASFVKTDGTATRITWNPVWLDAGHEYAIVILTDDGEAAVKIAELGKYDNIHERWVTSQPYQVGVLLSSSNASTWTPHQNMDLTFRLLACRFTEKERTVELGEIHVESISDIIALANIERVTSETDITFTLSSKGKDKKIQQIELMEDMPLSLQEGILGGKISIKAHIKGSPLHSAVLYPGIQFIGGMIEKEGDYITRAIPAAIGYENVRVTITFEAFTPSPSRVAVLVETAALKWSTAEETDMRPVGGGWIERTHTYAGAIMPFTRIKLVLSGNTSSRPAVRSLRVVII